jgi:hypothetical protein
VTTYTAYVYTVVDEAARTVRPVPKSQKPVRTYDRAQVAWFGVTRSLETTCSPDTRRVKLVCSEGRPDEWHMPQWVLRASQAKHRGYRHVWKIKLPVQCQPYVLAEE